MEPLRKTVIESTVLIGAKLLRRNIVLIILRLARDTSHFIYTMEMITISRKLKEIVRSKNLSSRMKSYL